MAIVIVQKKLTLKEFNQAREDYQSYIKITIDLIKKKVALGGEYHADAEKLLLESGSKQENIFGGGFNLELKKFETNAIINLRSRKNESTEILDEEKRKKFLIIAKRILKNYVS